MNMTMEEKVPFNQLPHYISRDFRNKKIAHDEYFLCLYLYDSANPYGIVTTSLDAIRDDAFPRQKKNTANKTLLSLLKKEQYVYFQKRQGRRGTFEIHLNHIRLPKGKGYKTLDNYFANKKIANEEYPQPDSAEANQKLGEQNQKFAEAKKEFAQRFSATAERPKIRSYQNDTESEKKIENHDSLDKKSFNGAVRDFTPSNYEEERCQQIAADVGEPYMDFLLSVLRKHGLTVIERAWGLFKEDRARGKEIINPPAYFNGIIQKLISDKNEPKHLQEQE